MLSIVRSFVVVLLALAVLGVAASDVSHAQSARMRKQIERNSAQIRENRQRIKQLEQKEGELKTILHSYDTKIGRQQEELSKVKLQLAQAEESLVLLEQELETLKRNLAGYRKSLASRMRAMYMQGDMSYLDLLFNAGDFGDFVDRLFFVQSICSRDEELIELTQRDTALLVQKGQEVAGKIEEIKAIRAQQEVQLAEMRKVEQAKKSDLQAVSQSKELYEQETAELERSNRQIQADLRAISRGGGGYSGKAWKGNFAAPVNGRVTSGFGVRLHPIYGGSRMHNGIDFGAPKGTRINAAGDGKVILAKYYFGYGNTVIIDHGGGRSTLYGHCSRITCSVGDIVKAGQKIAEVGSTGSSTGNHLHFEVRIRDVPVDPNSVTSL